MEDDEEKTGETGASTRTTSVESEIGTVNFQSSHPTHTHTHTYTPSSWAELSHDVQDFNESMPSKNITLDDIDIARIHWKRSGMERP